MTTDVFGRSVAKKDLYAAWHGALLETGMGATSRMSACLVGENATALLLPLLLLTAAKAVGMIRLTSD